MNKLTAILIQIKQKDSNFKLVHTESLLKEDIQVSSNSFFSQLPYKSNGNTHCEICYFSTLHYLNLTIEHMFHLYKGQT